MRRILVRALVILVVAFAGFVVVRSDLALRAVWRIDEADLALPSDADAIARDEHIAITRGCSGCHDKNFGGDVVFELAPIGRMAAPNITSGKGGVIAGFTPRDWERAIRHGVKPDGHALLFMLVRDFAGLSDADTADLIAYVMQQPPVDRSEPPSFIGLVGRALFGLGMLPMLKRDCSIITPHTSRASKRPRAPTSDTVSRKAAPVATANMCRADRSRARHRIVRSRPTSRRTRRPASARGRSTISIACSAKARNATARRSIR